MATKIVFGSNCSACGIAGRFPYCSVIGGRYPLCAPCQQDYDHAEALCEKRGNDREHAKNVELARRSGVTVIHVPGLAPGDRVSVPQYDLNLPRVKGTVCSIRASIGHTLVFVRIDGDNDETAYKKSECRRIKQSA